MSRVSSDEQRNKSVRVLAFSLEAQLERQRRVVFSYQFASGNRNRSRLAQAPWITLLITVITCQIWCMTAYQVAMQAGAHTFEEVLSKTLSRDENANVLITFGAKYT